MTKKQKNLDDLRFIYEKVDWYLKQKPEEIIRYFQEHRMDSLYSIPHKRLGMIICGREASEKFYNIAERYLISQKEGKNKTNLDEFVVKLKEEFSRRFLQENEEINENRGCPEFCVNGFFNYRIGIRSSNIMLNRLRAAFQFWSGIVHF